LSEEPQNFVFPKECLNRNLQKVQEIYQWRDSTDWRATHEDCRQTPARSVRWLWWI